MITPMKNALGFRPSFLDVVLERLRRSAFDRDAAEFTRLLARYQALPIHRIGYIGGPSNWMGQAIRQWGIGNEARDEAEHDAWKAIGGDPDGEMELTRWESAEYSKLVEQRRNQR